MHRIEIKSEKASRKEFKKTQELMREAGSFLEQFFKGYGFALIIFPFGLNQTGNYISNAERPEMIKVLRELADRLEERM